MPHSSQSSVETQNTEAFSKMMGLPPQCRPEEKYAIRKMAISSFVTVIAGIGFIRILPVLLESVGGADLN